MKTRWSEMNHGITCIDVEYMRVGLACFYLLQEKDELAVIETGTTHSVPYLLRLMAERGLQHEQVRYVIPTHVHLDHAGGAGAMMQQFPQASLLVHPRGARHLVDPAKLIAGSIAVYGENTFRALYGEITPIPEARVIPVDDGATFDLAGRALEFRHTPGHADHHFCIWDARSQGWFTGDVMGISYPELRFTAGDFVLPSTTPVQFNPEALLSSIELLRRYAPERCYLTHYGELTGIDRAAALMSRQVSAYRDIALENADAADRGAHLAAALWD